MKHTKKSKIAITQKWAEKGYRDGLRDAQKIAVDPVAAAQAVQFVHRLLANYAAGKLNPTSAVTSGLRRELFEGLDYLKLVVDSGTHRKILDNIAALVEGKLLRREVVNENKIADTLSYLSQQWDVIENQTKQKLLAFAAVLPDIIQSRVERLLL